MRLESGIGIELNWPLLTIKISLKSRPQLNEGPGLPASPLNISRGFQSDLWATFIVANWGWLKSMSALGQAGDREKAILSILPSYPGLGPPFPRLPSLDPYILLSCLPRDCTCPFFNFILTFNLNLLFPFPPGPDWSSTPVVESTEKAWPGL